MLNAFSLPLFSNGCSIKLFGVQDCQRLISHKKNKTAQLSNQASAQMLHPAVAAGGSVHIDILC